MFTLVIGGAASGKSAWAEEFVSKQPGKRIYLATMQPYGEEGFTRVKKHREQRSGKGFDTLERYTDLAHAPVPAGSSVLLEDLGNLAANELFSSEGGGSEAVLEEIEFLLRRCDNLTVVANELFSGGRAYADDTLRYLRELARIHRILAGKAELVVELVCGQPNLLKGVD